MGQRGHYLMKGDTFPGEDSTVINRLYPTAKQPRMLRRKLREEHHHSSLPETLLPHSGRRVLPTRVLLGEPTSKPRPGFRGVITGTGAHLLQRFGKGSESVVGLRGVPVWSCPVSQSPAVHLLLYPASPWMSPCFFSLLVCRSSAF